MQKWGRGMELKKCNIHMNKVKCRSNLQITLDEDNNVPDMKADMRHIIREQGNVRVTEKKMSNGKLFVKGLLEYTVLYLSERGEHQIESLRGEIPFDEIIHMEDGCSGDTVCLRVDLEELEVSMIHSRKIAVRSLLQLFVTVEELYDEEAAIGMEEEANVYMCSKRIPVTTIALNQKDTSRLKEELVLPAGKSNMEEMLYWELDLKSAEARVSNDQVAVKGELLLFLLYQGENNMEGRRGSELEFYETTIPFQTSYTISVRGDELVDDISFMLNNENVSIKQDEDGEARLLEVEAVLEADLKLYEEKELEILTDVYATNQVVTPVRKEAQYENLLLKNASRMRVTERVALGEKSIGTMLQICHGNASVKIDECKSVQDGLEVEGALEVKLLYISEEDEKPLQSLHTLIPFTHRIEVKGMNEQTIYDLKPVVADTMFSMFRTDEVEVKADVVFTLLAMERKREEMIEALHYRPFGEEEIDAMPGILGYRVQQGDSLWEIAKRYYTTVSEIMQMNELTSEEIKVGDKLLLLKQMVSIL